MRKTSVAVIREQILQSIVIVRSQKLILDHHLAALYEAPTGVDSGREAQFRSIPAGLHVSAFVARVPKLEITNCDLKFVGWSANGALRIYGTRGGDAVERASQPAGHRGEH